MPGREDVALLLAEAMRGEGWTGGRMEERRRSLEKKTLRDAKQRHVRDVVQTRLGISPRWWGEQEWDASSSTSSDDEDENDGDESLYVSPFDDTSTAEER